MKSFPVTQMKCIHLWPSGTAGRADTDPDPVLLHVKQKISISVLTCSAISYVSWCSSTSQKEYQKGVMLMLPKMPSLRNVGTYGYCLNPHNLLN